jgi:hypothetical protein
MSDNPMHRCNPKCICGKSKRTTLPCPSPTVNGACFFPRGVQKKKPISGTVARLKPPTRRRYVNEFNHHVGCDALA